MIVSTWIFPLAKSNILLLRSQQTLQNFVTAWTASPLLCRCVEVGVFELSPPSQSPTRGELVKHSHSIEVKPTSLPMRSRALATSAFCLHSGSYSRVPGSDLAFNWVSQPSSHRLVSTSWRRRGVLPNSTISIGDIRRRSKGGRWGLGGRTILENFIRCQFDSSNKHQFQMTTMESSTGCAEIWMLRKFCG